MSFNIIQVYCKSVVLWWGGWTSRTRAGCRCARTTAHFSLTERRKKRVLGLEMQYDMQDTTVAEDFIVQKHGLLNIDLGNKAISINNIIYSSVPLFYTIHRRQPKPQLSAADRVKYEICIADDTVCRVKFKIGYR